MFALRYLVLLSVFFASQAGFASPVPSEMLEKMRSAYGGPALMNLTSARMRLETRGAGEALPNTADMHYDFRNIAIARSETTSQGLERKIAGTDRGYSFIGSRCAPLSEKEEHKLIAGLYGNFLFLLSDSQTMIAPPSADLPKAANSHLAWYHVFRPGWKGLHIGVDPQVGLIREFWFGGNSIGRELDYRFSDGVMWPFRFEIYEGDKLVTTGHFSEVHVSRSGDDDVKVPDYCMQLLMPQ